MMVMICISNILRAFVKHSILLVFSVQLSHL